MAKVNDKDRQLYNEKVSSYVSMTKSLLDIEKKLQLESKKRHARSRYSKNDSLR